MVRSIVLLCLALTVLTGCFRVQNGDDVTRVRQGMGASVQPAVTGLYWKTSPDGVVRPSDPVVLVRKILRDGRPAYAVNSSFVYAFPAGGNRYFFELVDKGELTSADFSTWSVADVQGGRIVVYGAGCTNVSENMRKMIGLVPDGQSNCTVRDATTLKNGLTMAVQTSKPANVYVLKQQLPDF
ncbi:hypothetical protein [Chachezhania sediminis]|uniref:hypothetical protein n=1 Tax=Chachezhania sediminis TaxID=2599291 RepID=UPI00131DEAE8|nr:hypothetical protein [Chachezhania sediminis]